MEKELTALEQLTADIKAKTEKTALDFKEKREVDILTSKLNYVGSKAHLNEENVRANMTILKALEANVEREVDRMSFYFGLNPTLNIIVALCLTVRYSPNSVSLINQMGLTEEIVDSLLKAVGREAYYDVNRHTIVSSIPYDVPALAEVLSAVSVKLSLSNLDLNNVTEENFRNRHIRADKRASEEYADNAEHLAVLDDIKEGANGANDTDVKFNFNVDTRLKDQLDEISDKEDATEPVAKEDTKEEESLADTEAVNNDLESSSEQLPLVDPKQEAKKAKNTKKVTKKDKVNPADAKKAREAKKAQDKLDKEAKKEAKDAKKAEDDLTPATA